ncbi:RNA-directed DNA polymerase from mobile element jockey [Takifugu flavidus]|uniref:RNA-directed DNA polymerase from mobile element jockey n=1 Tax=Takifugu flavidus TaxID=433684 RepID=A0A5C6NY95_9TELE|nr:RNA-directed DNA polymerase from mobile element jockey [Takifugu flavidus]
MSSNFILLNSGKTEVMVFGPEPLRDRLDHTITLDGISLTSSLSVRNLGVTFDQNLSFNSHIKKSREVLRGLAPSYLEELVTPYQPNRLHRPQNAGLLVVPRVSKGYQQANVIILPDKLADDFEEFCQKNPVPLPLLYRSKSGQSSCPPLAKCVDIRTDISQYNVYENGKLVKTISNLQSYSSDISFGFEGSLKEAGIPVRNVEQGTNVSMYKRSENFCVENTVPTRTVRSFSNSKPWITPDIKALLKEKKRAFVSGDKEELKTVQRELRRKIRQEKDNYRRKMENQLQQNNICGVWKGLKTISGFKEQKSQPVGDRGWANDLNLFFNRFDQVPTPPPAQSPLLLPPPLSVPATHCSSCPPSSPSLMNFSSHIPDTSHPGPCPSPPPTPPCSSLSLTPHQVRKALKKNRARKATGPDSISSRLLKSCADQLCGIFSHMFNLSLRLGRVPQLWKTCCIVPVPKTPHPKELNSYRPVALTSHLMKTLERLILDHLRPLVSSFMDPLQFAYQPSIGVDDAVIYLLHTSLTHLEKAGSTVRIMFFDFSSAFNTIQPRLLGDKLEVAGVDHHLTTWILDYLTQRPQFVRVKGSQSDRLLCSTGVPQGTVLAPFLFTLYTADFSYSTSSCHLQMFSDDSAAVDLITDGDDTEYRELIQGFVDWSLRNNLQINAGKIKELVVDFRRRNNPPPAPVNILGTDVDVVESYKYLGVHLNNNLDWTHNTDALVKKGNSRLFLLRRLRSFGVQGPLLRTFYDSVVGSAIFYGIVCWSSSITDRDRKRMDRLVRRASYVLGCPLDSVEVVGNGRMMAKLSSMLNNTSHPLQDTLTALGSSFSERLLHPRCVKERYRRSFLPAAVRLHNKHNAR